MSDKQNITLLKTKPIHNKLNIDQNQLSDLITNLKSKLDSYDNLIRTFLLSEFTNKSDSKKAQTKKLTSTKKLNTQHNEIIVDNNQAKSVWDLIQHQSLESKPTQSITDNNVNLTENSNDIKLIEINKIKSADNNNNKKTISLWDIVNNQSIINHTNKAINQDEIVFLLKYDKTLQANENIDNENIKTLNQKHASNNESTITLWDLLDNVIFNKSNKYYTDWFNPYETGKLIKIDTVDALDNNEDDIVVIVKDKLIKPVFIDKLKADNLPYSQLIYKGDK